MFYYYIYIKSVIDLEKMEVKVCFIVFYFVGNILSVFVLVKNLGYWICIYV